MKIKFCGSLVIISCIVSSTTLAAEIPEIGESFGGVVGIMDIAEIVDPAVKLLAKPPTLKASITPAFVSADGSDIAGASIDLSKENHTFQFRILNINPDGSDSISQYRGSYKFTIPTSDETLSYGVSARYVETENAHNSVGILGLIEKQFTGISGKTMVASGNIKWRDRNYDAPGTPDTDAVGGAIGVATVISSKFILSIDYNFEDDLNNDDTISVTGILPMKLSGNSAKFIIGADDDETLTLAAKYSF